MLEDEVFTEVDKLFGITRTKSMYRKADVPHDCTMCKEPHPNVFGEQRGYALKSQFVTTLNTPYLFICEDCYKELPDD